MKKILFVFILFFVLIINVKAESLNTSLECSPVTVYKNETITCDIYVTPNDFVLNGLQANYSLINGSFVSFEPSSSFSVKNSGELESKGFVLTSVSNITSKTKVGVLKVRSNSTPGYVNIKLTNISASKPNYESIDGNDILNKIQLLFSLDKPFIEDMSYQYNKVTLTIKEDESANKYKIYRSTSSSSGYKYLSTISSNVYEDTNVVVGKTYYYKVKSVNDESTKVYTSSYSDYRKVTTRLSTPEINVSSVNATSVTLSWNKVTGAQGYRIYRSTSLNGTYLLIKTITSGSTLTYKNTSRVTNTTYYYKIKAYRVVSGSKKYSYYSNKVSARPVLNKPIIESVSNDYYRYIKININRVSYSHGYNIYRSETEDGTYKYIGSTTKETYYDKTSKEGINYYYKVKAYRKYSGKKKYSEYSEVSLGLRLNDTINISVTKEKSKLIFNITKIENVSKYEIWRKDTKNGSYKLIKTLDSNNYLEQDVITYENNNLKSNKTYYYKVRVKYNNYSDYKYLTIKTIK